MSWPCLGQMGTLWRIDSFAFSGAKDGPAYGRVAMGHPRQIPPGQRIRSSAASRAGDVWDGQLLAIHKWPVFLVPLIWSARWTIF